uniref:Uncharacterized protein n=1 Tax=viral metagenome TaxID=1070528 RepID=A0A6C0B9E7_9ZZZZ
MDIAPYDQTKWIVLSSFFFTIPAMYAYLYHLYKYSILLVCTSLISANYWRKATYSWRRNMDLLFAKFAFIVFVSNGVVYVKKMSYVITGYSGLIILLYCYYLSGKLLEIKHNDWYKFHMAFHFIMMYEQFIILDSILLDRKFLQGGP